MLSQIVLVGTILILEVHGHGFKFYRPPFSKVCQFQFNLPGGQLPPYYPHSSGWGHGDNDNNPSNIPESPGRPGWASPPALDDANERRRTTTRRPTTTNKYPDYGWGNDSDDANEKRRTTTKPITRRPTTVTPTPDCGWNGGWNCDVDDANVKRRTTTTTRRPTTTTRRPDYGWGSDIDDANEKGRTTTRRPTTTTTTTRRPTTTTQVPDYGWGNDFENANEKRRTTTTHKPSYGDNEGWSTGTGGQASWPRYPESSYGTTDNRRRPAESPYDNFGPNDKYGSASELKPAFTESNQRPSYPEEPVTQKTRPSFQTEEPIREIQYVTPDDNPKQPLPPISEDNAAERFKGKPSTSTERSPGQGWGRPPTSPVENYDQRFAEDVADTHNYYRAIHRVGPVVLDDNLSKYAQEVAERFARGERFTNSESAVQKEIGESIVMNNGPASGSNIVDNWYKEHTNFDFENPVLVKMPPRYANNHFTSIVWSDTNSLGVGKARAEDGREFIVVNYYPPTNDIKALKSNVFPPKPSKNSSGSHPFEK